MYEAILPRKTWVILPDGYEKMRMIRNHVRQRKDWIESLIFPKSRAISITTVLSWKRGCKERLLCKVVQLLVDFSTPPRQDSVHVVLAS